MTKGSDEALRTLQHEVQRLLGRCLLQLQQTEVLLKHIVAHSEISGPASEIEQKRAERVFQTQRKTLGVLTKDVHESFLSAIKNDESEDEIGTFPDKAGVIFRHTVGFFGS